MITIVIPHVPNVGAEKLLIECINSFDIYDRIIIESNKDKSFAENTNEGLKKAREIYSSFIIVANNDTKLISGSLTALLDPTAFTVPKIEPLPRDHRPRCFFCMPLWIYMWFISKDGYFYDERFKRGFWEDDDLNRRLERDNIITKLIPSVIVSHLGGGGFTIKQFGEQKYFDINKNKFEEKWEEMENWPPYDC